MVTQSADTVGGRQGEPSAQGAPEGDHPDTGTTATRAPGYVCLDDLLTVLDLAGDVPPVPARCLPSLHGGVLGAQLLGQQIVLAERLAPGKQTHTVHALFMRSGDCHAPLWVDVERLAHGRSVDSLALSFRQGSLQICRSDVLLRAPEPDFLRLETPAADLVGPEHGTPVERAMAPWDVRVLPRADTHQLDHWQRISAAPDDPALWRALLAHTCEILPMSDLLSASGLPSGLSTRAPAVVVSQTVTFYDELDVRDWHLFRVRSLHAGHGRAVGRVEIFDHDGKLCAGSEAIGVVRAPRSA